MENNFIPEGLLNCSRQLYSPDEHVLLKCQEGTSDKFWAAIPDKGDYIITWGRNGKKPNQSQIISKWEAQNRLAEKLNKGYDYCRQNELLQHFKNNPSWFAKVKGSPEFNASIQAYALSISLENKTSKPKTAKMKI
jgi:predicted DNA-binding WGR domain protein